MTWHAKQLQIQAEHLARMALTPGFLEHARHRARELETDRTGLYKGLGAAVKKIMDGQAEKSASEPQGPEKQP